MIDEAKRWEAILAQDVTIKGEQGTVTMTMSELLEWLETETGFLKREMRHAFLTQYQRATVHRDQARAQFAKNHYCGGNCATCGEYECDVCDTCQDLWEGGYCAGNRGICDMNPDGIIKYAEELADWVSEYRKARNES